MKRYGMLAAFVLSLMLPAAVLAQYDYPMGGSDMGGDRPSGADVTIVDFAFEPTLTMTHPGDSVSWSNAGGAPHTVTANDGAFDSGTISPGGDFSVSFATNGFYSYHCSIHPNMHGMIVVSGM